MTPFRTVRPPSRHRASESVDWSDEREPRSKSTCAQLKSASILPRDSAEPRSRSSSLQPCRGFASRRAASLRVFSWRRSSQVEQRFELTFKAFDFALLIGFPFLQRLRRVIVFDLSKGTTAAAC